MIKIDIDKDAEKYLNKLKKSNKTAFDDIVVFLYEVLANSDKNPKNIGRKIIGSKDDRYRWRVGQYRIIGYIKEDDNTYIVQVIKIEKRSDTTYSHTKR